MAQHSRYQQKIIKNFYDNRESIALQRLSELVTELYLTEGKKLEQHWKTVRTHMAALGMKEDRIEHLCRQKDPALIARVVEEFMEKVKK